MRVEMRDREEEKIVVFLVNEKKIVVFSLSPSLPPQHSGPYFPKGFEEVVCRLYMSFFGE